MGTKQVTGESKADHRAAFEAVMRDHPPTTNAPRHYRVVDWRAEAGGFVYEPVYYVDVEVSGEDVTEDAVSEGS